MTTWANGTPTTEKPPPPPPEFSEPRLADGGWWAGVPRPPKTTSGIHFFQDLQSSKQAGNFPFPLFGNFDRVIY